ncbi:phage tail length tape measure family protein [Comamonas aquatica]|uniref:phage tail length tape measure family protein n=1 Tax=Comamonas aquatica TaxID=225991 RepID=UPI00244C7A2D|nr:phage tail length tape measure family protein [Comamonas aquatica]MDH1766251.1 phage tail length tape measure family protein [Comamonas aquatica]
MATAGNDMNVALRVQTDLAQAAQEIKQLRAQLDAVGTSAAKAAQGQTQGSASGTQASKENTKAAKETNAALQAQAQAAREAAKAQQLAAQQAAQAQKQAAKAAAEATAELEKQRKAAEKKALAEANAAAKAAAKAGRTEANLKKNADRMLPAQMTDIGVGLATGQSPLMVALQQGGQLKDMYGGITPALTAVGKATLALVNPTTVALGAVTALGAAWYQGAKEGEAFTAAILMNGNAAGTTTSQLTSTSQAVGRVTGSYSLAIEATRELAATGRVANAQLSLAAQATVGMAQVGAAAVGDMTTKFAELGKSPVEASRKLNEQYNYLTASVYEQIKALEEQGRKEEAAALAQRTFGQAMVDRSNEVKAELNALGLAFNWMGEQAGWAWNKIKNIGRADTGDEIIEAAQKQVDFLRKRLEIMQSRGLATGNLGAKLAAAEGNLAAEQAKKTANELAAQDKAAKAAREKETIAASDSWDARAKSLRKWDKQLEDEIETIQKQGKLLGKTEEAINTQIAAARDKLTPKTATKVNPVDTAFQTQLQQLTQARAAAEQGLANAQANVGSTQEQATAKLEAWLSVNQHALKLDAVRIAQLRSLAQQTDAATEAAKTLQDARARAERITSGMASVDSALAQATGRTVDAEIARIKERYRKLREDLQAEDNTEGLVKLDKLIDVETAKAQLQDLQRQVELVFGNQSRQEQTLQLSVTAGLTSELDAKRQILEMNTRTADQIAALLPRMQELAAITGDPSMAAGLADMELRVQGLRTQANELKNTFSDALGNSFANALESLADGTATLGDAVRGFVADLAKAMAQWAAQQLAMRAASSIMGMFGATAVGFSSGGYTGHGGKYQPAGTVHKGEFVHRQEVVRQPGALAFLSEFNRVGMAALKGWQGYADGGLVVPGAHSGVPTSANFQPATVNVGGSTVDNRLQLNLIDDPDRIASMAFGSRQGEEAFTVMLSRNPAKFRQLLGVGN